MLARSEKAGDVAKLRALQAVSRSSQAKPLQIFEDVAELFGGIIVVLVDGEFQRVF